MFNNLGVRSLRLLRDVVRLTLGIKTINCVAVVPMIRTADMMP